MCSSWPTYLQQSFRIFSLTPLPCLVRYRLLVLVCPLMALVAVGLGLLDRDLPWLADLATHWVWPAFGVSLAACLFGSMKERLLSLGSLALCAGLLVAAAPPGKTATPEGVAVRLASANVLSTNTDYATFANWVRLTQPDVIAVLEVNAPWGAALEGLASYPYRKIVAREDNFGIALLSKLPMTAEVSTPPSLAHLFPPSISAIVAVPGALPLKNYRHPSGAARQRGGSCRAGSSFGVLRGGSQKLRGAGSGDGRLQCHRMVKRHAAHGTAGALPPHGAGTFLAGNRPSLGAHLD